MHVTNSPESAPPAAAPSPAPEAERLLRLPLVLEAVGIGRTGWLDMVRTGEAPPPVRIGRAVAWPASEVQAFIRQRIRQSRGGAR